MSKPDIATAAAIALAAPAPAAPGRKLQGPRAPGSKRKLLGRKMPPGDGLPGTTAEEGTIGVWGSDAASVTGYGTVSSASLTKSATREGYPNGDGEFTGYCYYNFLTEGEFECLIPSDGITALDAGDEISIGGATLLVDSATELWNLGAWAKYRCKASKHATVAATT